MFTVFYDPSILAAQKTQPLPLQPPYLVNEQRLVPFNCTDKRYTILHQECKVEEDLNPRLNGNPFQDNQWHANHYTINLMMKLHYIILYCMDMKVRLRRIRTPVSMEILFKITNCVLATTLSTFF